MNTTALSDLIPCLCNSDIKNELTMSVTEYRKVTKEHMIKYMSGDILKNCKVKHNFVQHVLSNQDLFTDIVDAVILADWSHDATKSSQRYWRTKCIIYTISHIHRKKKQETQQIDTDFEDNKTPYVEAIRKERHLVINESLLDLNKRERQIIKYKFYRNFPERKIAQRLNISRPRVGQILSNIKYKLAPKLETLV